MQSTSLTLLRDLQDLGNHERWAEFHSLYAPLIVKFAARMGCRNETMRKEILQATMISLTRVLPRLDYDREKSGFRALLCTIVRNHLRSAWRRNRAVVVDAGLPDWEIDRMVDENPQANPEAVWDRLWRQNILLQALERARRQVEPSTYESFSRHVLSGQSAAVVARDLGMTVNAVHQHRHRLIVILRRHVRELCLEVGENVEERANGL